MSRRESRKSRYNSGALEPGRHLGWTQLHEDAFASVLDGREPCRLDLDGRPFNIGVVLAVDVGHDSLETREARQCENFAQPVKLEHGLNSDEPSSLSPRGVG